MLTTSQEFKDAMRAPVKQVTGYLQLQDGSKILPGGNLQKFTVEGVGGFLRTAMSKLSSTLLGEQKLVGSVVDVYYGVTIGTDVEYALKGSFNITEATYDKEKRTTAIVGYDNMAKFNSDYSTVGNYPTTLFDYLQAICSLAGVALENETIYNGTMPVEEDYYQNVGGYSIRDVLEDICEASASYAVINTSGNIELRQITDTGEVLTYDDMKEYKLGDYWGGINSLVLSRQPQNDDVFMRDESDISAPTTRNVLDLDKFTVGYKVGDS